MFGNLSISMLLMTANFQMKATISAARTNPQAAIATEMMLLFSVEEELARIMRKTKRLIAVMAMTIARTNQSLCYYRF